MNTATQFSRKAPKILFFGFAVFSIAGLIDYIFYGFHAHDLVRTISFALLALGYFRIDRAGGKEDKASVAILVTGLALGIGQILMRHLA